MSRSGLSAGVLAGVGFAGGIASAETPLERGEYLVRGPMSCGNCHTPQGPNGPDMSKELAGGQLIIDDAMMQAYSANITPARAGSAAGRTRSWRGRSARASGRTAH